MPRYVTEAELSAFMGANQLTHLADKDGDGSSDTAAIDAALSHAEGLVDSYCSRFLPIEVVTDVIRTTVIDIAIYRLAGNLATKKQYDDWNAAMRWLRDIQAGRAYIGDVTTPKLPYDHTTEASLATPPVDDDDDFSGVL